MNAQEHSNMKTGLLSALLAYGMWGFFPIYFILLRGIPAEEVLTHRILWAVPFGALIIGMRNQWGQVLDGFKNRKVLFTLMGSASIIAFNWLIYVIAVQSGNIFQASLGYYINPLMYVILGVVVLHEKLRRGQLIAVIFATIGVMVLTIYGGSFPTISLTLAVSFTIYGFLRKQVAIGAMPGLFIETALLIPFAAIALIYFTVTRDTGLESAPTSQIILLVLAGPLTVLPLLFFAIAARNLTLATLGFMQFIGPSIQFLIGLIDGEAFTRAHQICFGLIWLAVAIFATDAWRNRPKPIPQKTK